MVELDIAVAARTLADRSLVLRHAVAETVPADDKLRTVAHEDMPGNSVLEDTVLLRMVAASEVDIHSAPLLEETVGTVVHSALAFVLLGSQLVHHILQNVHFGHTMGFVERTVEQVGIEVPVDTRKFGRMQLEGQTELGTAEQHNLSETEADQMVVAEEHTAHRIAAAEQEWHCSQDCGLEVVDNA